MRPARHRLLIAVAAIVAVAAATVSLAARSGGAGEKALPYSKARYEVADARLAFRTEASHSRSARAVRRSRHSETPATFWRLTFSAILAPSTAPALRTFRTRAIARSPATLPCIGAGTFARS